MILHAEEFNRATNCSKDFNCLAFALSITNPSAVKGGFDLLRVFDYTRLSLRQSFIWKANDAGIKVKEVTSFHDLSGKVGFLVYGWYAFNDFHVVRVNPDGTWEHKPDYTSPACQTSEDELQKEYSEGPTCYFILDE